MSGVTSSSAAKKSPGLPLERSDAFSMSENDQEHPDIWSSAAHNKIPDDAWEYQTRKSLNDAAYKSLDYVPYSSTMPVRRETDEPKFVWKKKGSR